MSIKRSVWLKLSNIIIITSLLFTFFTVSVFADTSQDIVNSAVQKPLVFSWMQEDDHVDNSTSVSATGANVPNPTATDFTLIDNPYPTILNQYDKVWASQLDFRNFDGSTLELINFSVTTEFYLPVDTSFGEATYLTFGVFAMLDTNQFVSDIIDELTFSIGDVGASATRYNIIDGNKLVAFFTIDSSNIQQSMSQQKVKMSITFGDWYPYDPFYGEAPYFYLQFGDIIQTISMTANQAYLDNIFGLLQGNSSNNQAGSDFNNSMKDEAENMNGLVDDINGLYKPSVDELNPQDDLLNYFGGGTTHLTGFMKFISDSALPIASMLIIVVSASFISFVLFGKK